MFDRFRKKGREPSGAPEFLIVGLGKPWRQIRGDAPQYRLYLRRSPRPKARFQDKKSQVQVAVRRRSPVRSQMPCDETPDTFMNNSGISVREAAQFYKIPPQNIIIIFDDISLPPGRLRIRAKGSAGGHNGLKSIIYHLNSDEFPRVKIGVGDRPDHSSDLAGWVLSGFSKDDVPARQRRARQGVRGRWRL